MLESKEDAYRRMHRLARGKACRRRVLEDACPCGENYSVRKHAQQTTIENTKKMWTINATLSEICHRMINWEKKSLHATCTKLMTRKWSCDHINDCSNSLKKSRAR